MSGLVVTMNLDIDPWVDLAGALAAQGEWKSASIERIGLLPDGTRHGHPTVALAIRTPDGRVFLAETTWRLMHSAMTALAASPVVEIDGLTS